MTLLKSPSLVPAPLSKATTRPPLVKWGPASCRDGGETAEVAPALKKNGTAVTVEGGKLTGPGMTAGTAVTVESDRLTVPVVTVMDAVEATALPPMVAVMVRAVPAVVPVKVAV